MGKGVTDRIEEQVRSFFPAAAIARVQVLEYGDEPEVEPGETAIRVFISRAGRPEGKEANEEIVEAFKEANHAVIKKVRDGLPASSAGSSSALTGRSRRQDLGVPSSGSAAAGGGLGHWMKCPRN